MPRAAFRCDTLAPVSDAEDAPKDPSVADDQSAGADAGVPHASLDKRKTIIGAIVTLIVIGLVFWALSKQFGSFADAWSKITAMAPVAIASLALVAVVNIIVYVFPYMVAIPGLKYRPAFMVRQTSWMMAALVPAGGAFALALQYMMLASYRVSAAVATSGIGITSVWSFFMTFLLPVLGVLVLVPTGKLESAWVYAGIIGAIALVAMVIVFWLILRSEASARKIAGWGQKISDPLLRKLNRQMDLTSSVLNFREEVVDVVKAKWISLTITNLAVSFMQFMILFVAIRGISGDQDSSGITFAEIFAAFAISRLGTLIPITPGGLGTVAGVLGTMLATFGMNQEDILAAVLVWQMVQLFPQAITGLATLLGWRVQEARKGKAPAAA